MSFYPDAEDLAMLYQHHKEIHSKIELLDSSLKTIDSLEGIAIEATISIDADSDVRRSYSGTINLGGHNRISQYSVSDWTNKFVRIYIGMKNVRTQEIKWYSLGLYTFNSNGFQYNATTYCLSVSCVDLVAKLDDTLSGQLTGSATIIKEGRDIRQSIIETLSLMDINKYLVEYWTRTVPYDLEFGTGATVWEILTTLRDLYYPFEMYFDDDTFVCKEIPSCATDDVLIDYTVMDKMIIEEDSTIDYAEVRNCVEVWGASLNSDTYASEVSFSDNTYYLTIVEAKLRNNAKFSFLAPATNGIDTYVHVSYTDSEGTTTTAGPFQLYGSTDDDGNDIPLTSGTIQTGKYYVVKYDKTNSKFYYQGQTDSHAMVFLVDEQPTEAEIEQAKIDEACDNLKYIVTNDPDDTLGLYNSPFTVGKIGRRNLVCSGGDYEDIYTDSLAMERAEYEAWKHARLTDTVQITTLLIPWLDVNKKISYTPQYTGDGQPVEYITKKIEMSLASDSVGTMTIQMSKFYPYYPYIIDKS